MTTTKEAPDHPTDPLHEALRAKLRSLLDGPLTTRTLHEVEQSARLARQLLAVGKNPVVASRRRSFGNFSSAQVFNPSSIDTGDVAESAEDDDGLIGAPGYDMPLAGSPKAETFGATVIREAISAYADIVNRPRPPEPHQLILAISYAKDRGHVELAKRLEAALEASLLGSTMALVPELPTAAGYAAAASKEAAAAQPLCPSCKGTRYLPSGHYGDAGPCPTCNADGRLEPDWTAGWAASNGAASPEQQQELRRDIGQALGEHEASS